MKKRVVSFFMVTVLAITFLVGCGAKMPDTFDEEKAKTDAVEVVNLINAQDYQGVADLYREDLQTGVDVNSWANLFSANFAVFGELESVGKASVKVDEDKNTGEVSAVVTVVCKYVNGKMTYNVAYDGENNLIGFYLSNQENSK